MKEKLEELRKDIFLELSSWGGLGPMPGTQGLIITTDKKIYYYHNYYRIPKDLEDKVTREGITKGESISNELYESIINYIDNNIKGKTFDNPMIFDAGCKIIGKGFIISNHFDIYGELNKIIKGEMKNEK